MAKSRLIVKNRHISSMTCCIDVDEQARQNFQWPYGLVVGDIQQEQLVEMVRTMGDTNGQSGMTRRTQIWYPNPRKCSSLLESGGTRSLPQVRYQKSWQHNLGDEKKGRGKEDEMTTEERP